MNTATQVEMNPASAISQNIGCRQPSRYAANATAPSFGETTVTSSGK